MKEKKVFSIDHAEHIVYYRKALTYCRYYNHKTFRYQLEVIPERLYNKKTKALKVDDNYYDARATAAAISEKADKVHKAVSELIKTHHTITKNDVDTMLMCKASPQKVKVSSNTGLVEDYEAWIKRFNEKKLQDEIQSGKGAKKGTHPSTKDYISCLNLLKDFQHDNCPMNPIQIKDINTNFITSLMNYAWGERHNTPSYKYLTKGGLVNKTLKKRVDCLFTYLRDVTNGNLPNEIKKREIIILRRKIIRLETHELRMLIEAPMTDGRDIMIRDYFLFLCYTGLRFSDFSKLDRTYYRREDKELCLKSNKTFADCVIPLCEHAIQIAEKYGWNFHEYTNQALNRGIHDILEKYNLFGEMIEMEYMQDGRKVYYKPKRELITCHAGRRTFISRLVENGAEIHDIMTCTGHKKMETLQYYIDLFGNEKKKRLHSMIDNLEIK